MINFSHHWKNQHWKLMNDKNIKEYKKVMLGIFFFYKKKYPIFLLLKNILGHSTTDIKHGV